MSGPFGRPLVQFFQGAILDDGRGVSMPQFYTISQAQKILNVSRPTIYRKIKIKEIPATHLGDTDQGGAVMDGRDQIKADRAELLLAELKPELIRLLENAPPYGSCGFEVVLHQGQIIRTTMKSESTRKLTPRTGGNDGR
jgi:excisionase family DNA binding protein